MRCSLLLVVALLPLQAQGAGPDPLDAIDSIVRKAIDDKEIPGAVVLVGHAHEVVYNKAFGRRAVEPSVEPMTADTIFDVASLTKVVATTTAVMQLFEQGRLKLNDPVARYVPEFGHNGKQDITVRQLLTHYSGLAPDLDLTKPWQGRDQAWRMICQMAPAQPPGAGFLYSDINFEVLGILVERLSGMPLDQYAQRHIFTPLGMRETRFLPPPGWFSRIAPTQYDEGGVMLRGAVHDPTARRMGGVAGHAGLFSTAEDLAKFAEALLSGSSILSPQSVEKMTTPQQPPTATAVRGLGWDLDSPFSSNRGELLPVGSFGHTGFTGTSLWVDPTTQSYIILLANAVHPRGQGSAVSLRTRLATAVTAALRLTPQQQEKARWSAITGYNEARSAARHIAVRNGDVKTGIDVLEEHNFAEITHPEATRVTKRVGVLTNQTAVDSQGRRVVDVLAQAAGVSLEAIFSPEHGFTGTLDTVAVGDTRDSSTGVAIYSVYGPSDGARRPPIQILKSLDAIVVDLPDVGARFYTYETSLGYFLEAAAQAAVEIIVLDRPNPVTGAFVQGPLPDPGRESFVNYHPIPVRHGMTMGELALLFNAERKIRARLKVVAMQGWMRGDWYDSTGLAWVNPSPNLRSLAQATLYSGVALVEGTNLSVGRGTDTPFEIVGAPWVQGKTLAAYLNARLISGVRFVPVAFTPASSNFAGEKCEGVNILVLERNSVDAPELGIELASALVHLYPGEFQAERMMNLLARRSVLDDLKAGADPRRIAQDWQDELERFAPVRQTYLLYK